MTESGANAPIIKRAYAEVAGIQLHYRYAGAAHMPALLLLHQSPSSSVMYESLMLALANRFFLLAPDTPGFGNSDPLPGSGPLQIADYARVIHALLAAREIGPCAVFGHHTGAAIAVQLEHDYPGTATAMALSGPTLLDAAQQQNLPALASPFALEESGRQLQGMWERIRAKDPDAPLTLSQRELLLAFASGPSYQSSYSAVCSQDFAGQLPAIACPVLVFAGDQDPLFGAVAPTVALLQRGTTVSLPGGERTYVCERQPELVAGLLADFFSNAAPPGQSHGH